MNLKSTTDPRWISVALKNFEATLVDHAHCERKAAATALALVASYPEHSELVKRCTKLAQEELRHFQWVHDLLRARGIPMSRDRGDPYAKALQALVRQPPDERRTDRLLVCGLIEARSCERLALIGEHHPDPSLRREYQRLATAEAGHHRLFVELATRYESSSMVQARWRALAQEEAEIVSVLPIEPRIH